MSVMNFQSTFRDVKPPDKGSFPLDHEGQCSCLDACEVMLSWMIKSAGDTSELFMPSNLQHKSRYYKNWRGRTAMRY